MMLFSKFFNQEGYLYKMKRHRSMILPKEFVPCDFDASENLLELEDQTDGVRFWVPLKELKHLNYAVGEVYTLIMYDGHKIDVKFIRLESILYRKRYYLSPVFTIQEENDDLPF